MTTQDRQRGHTVHPAFTPRGAAHSVVPAIAPPFHGAGDPEQHNQHQHSFTDHDVLARVFWFWTLFLVSLVPLLIAVFMSKYG